MEVVVNSNRLKNFLYSLGYSFRQVPDRTHRQKYIYLFPNTKDLQEALKFYTKYHQNRVKQQKE